MFGNYEKNPEIQVIATHDQAECTRICGEKHRDGYKNYIRDSCNAGCKNTYVGTYPITGFFSVSDENPDILQGGKRKTRRHKRTAKRRRKSKSRRPRK